MSLPGVPADRCNMPGMTGRTFHSAVVQGLFVCLCLCEPLHAWQNSQTCEPQLSQTEEQDLETLRSAAEQGDAEAQFNLGLMYEQGQGIPQDYAEALRWYRLAAGQGYAAAQSVLGTMYHDTPRPFGGTASRRGQGYAAAQSVLGTMYQGRRRPPGLRRGPSVVPPRGGARDTPPRSPSSGRCTTRAQAPPRTTPRPFGGTASRRGQGYAAAQSVLGTMYHEGAGAPQDYAEALRWYRLAAGQGYAAAQGYLGLMYDKGQGVPEDYARGRPVVSALG